MAIVTQTDKRSGITYAYETAYYWDKEKQQSRRLSLKLIRKNLDDVYDDIRMFTSYDEGINTYGYTVTAEWDYT